MRRLARSALAGLLWLLLASPAFSAIGTPVNLSGDNSVTCQTPYNFTTSHDAPAGGAILVLVADTSLTATVTITDSASNTYTQQAAVSNTGALAIFGAFNITHLPSGGTITVHDNESGNKCMATAAFVSGLASSSSFDTSASSTTTTATPSIGLVTSSASEILIGADLKTNGAYAYSSAGTGFTSIGANTSGNFSDVWAYDIVSAAGSQTYAPTLNAAAQQHLLAAFSSVPIGVASAGSPLSMTGVGN